MDPLSQKEESALALLIQGASISEVAIRCQVSRTTIHAWLKKPELKGALDSARSAIRQQAIARLASFSDRALDVCWEFMEDDPDIPPALRLRAAELVMKSLDLQSMPSTEPKQAATGDVTPEQLDKVLYQIYGLTRPPTQED